MDTQVPIDCRIPLFVGSGTATRPASLGVADAQTNADGTLKLGDAVQSFFES